MLTISERPSLHSEKWKELFLRSKVRRLLERIFYLPRLLQETRQPRKIACLVARVWKMYCFLVLRSIRKRSTETLRIHWFLWSFKNGWRVVKSFWFLSAISFGQLFYLIHKYSCSSSGTYLAKFKASFIAIVWVVVFNSESPSLLSLKIFIYLLNVMPFSHLKFLKGKEYCAQGQSSF